MALVAASCGSDRAEPNLDPVRAAAAPSATPVAAGSRPASPSAAAPGSTELGPAAPPTVVFLGDSLTAGYGLDGSDAYPARVGELLAARSLPARVVNAGVPGDTTAGGLARLDWLLAQKPTILFVCLGGNDGLRGLALEATEANLRAIVVRAKAAGVEVVLAGMQIPPNYGPDYTSRFRAIFPRLAKELAVPLVSFLLEGVAADPTLNQADGIHPNARGQRIVAETVAKVLEPLLRDRVRKANAARG